MVALFPCTPAAWRWIRVLASTLTVAEPASLKACPAWFALRTVIVNEVSLAPGSDVSVPISFTFAGLHFWESGPVGLPCPGSAVALEAARAAVASATVTSLGRRIPYLQGSRSLPTIVGSNRLRQYRKPLERGSASYSGLTPGGQTSPFRRSCADPHSWRARRARPGRARGAPPKRRARKLFATSARRSLRLLRADP